MPTAWTIVFEARRATVGACCGVDGVVIAADYDWTRLARRTADLVDQLLKGAKPADLSMGAPIGFEVIVDGRVAKALGLTIPESVLSQADRVLN